MRGRIVWLPSEQDGGPDGAGCTPMSSIHRSPSRGSGKSVRCSAAPSSRLSAGDACGRVGSWWRRASHILVVTDTAGQVHDVDRAIEVELKHLNMDFALTGPARFSLPGAKAGKSAARRLPRSNRKPRAARDRK